MIITPGATSVSLDVRIVDDSGLAVTGLLAATFPATYWSIAGNTAATAITLSDLALITTAYSSGGVKERSGSAGVYRLDIPNAAVASAGDVTIYGEASGKHLLCEPLTVVALPAVDSSQRVLLQPTQTGVTIPTVTTVGTVTTLTNAPPDTSGTATLLTRLTSVRAGYLDTLNGIVAAIWAAVADSSGVATLLARLTGTRAGYLDNLSTAPPTLAAIRNDLERNGGSLYNAGAAATVAANNAAAIIDLIGDPAGVSIAADIAAIDTGGGGAGVEDIVDGMTTAGFAKIADVQNTYDLPVQ